MVTYAQPLADVPFLKMGPANVACTCRCVLCWSLLCAAAAGGADLASSAEAAQTLQAVLPAADLTGLADSEINNIQTVQTATAAACGSELTSSTSAAVPAGVVAAGILASLAARLGLGAKDLIKEHSLDGMRFRAFDAEDGSIRSAAVQQVVGWPVSRPGA
jgi:hypothetical protein